MRRIVTSLPYAAKALVEATAPASASGVVGVVPWFGGAKNAGESAGLPDPGGMFGGRTRPPLNVMSPHWYSGIDPGRTLKLATIAPP
jgi:hypothetical protein